MTLIVHELRRYRTALCIWSLAIGLLMSICVLVYPEIHNEAKDFSQMFASMGSFGDAFGLDQLNFGSLEGFYSIECGNIMGIGGACFAGWLGGGILSREESEHTAEFLLSHPVLRTAVFIDKLAAVFLIITAMNFIVDTAAVFVMYSVESSVPLRGIVLIDLAYYLMQLLAASACYGVSVLIHGNGGPIGIAVAAVFYFMSLIANMTETLVFLKYFTPFGFCQGSSIIADGHLDWGIAVSTALMAAVLLYAGYRRYRLKDIQ